MDIDESTLLQRQALEIPSLDENFDPTSQPQNGEEYLMHMLYERKKCPAVVVKKPEIQKLKPKSTTEIKGSKEQTTAKDISIDTTLVPTKEWKEQQELTFIQTRAKICLLRERRTTNIPCEKVIPESNDESAWLKFCLENTPQVHIIFQISQRPLEQLLAMLGLWLDSENVNFNNELNDTSSSPTSNVEEEQKKLSSDIRDLLNSEYWLGSWLYAVLACLQLPIEPNVYSSLRDIARTCVRLRSKLKPLELNKAIPYNLFIYLIGMIFHQYDLLEFV